MANSADLIRKYFSAYENKDRKAVESLLTDNFVFTSPYDYRIDRETHFKRCWPYSEKSPSYGIEKLFEKGSEVFVLYDCKTKDGGRSRNTELFVIERNKIKEVEVYFGSTPKDCGGLNGSTQHYLEVYFQESQQLKSFASVIQTEHYPV